MIKNFSQLSKQNSVRLKALKIINEGLKAISPSFVFKEKIKLIDNKLLIESKVYDLNNYKNIYVIGFGKAATLMAQEIENTFGDRIKNGLVIDIQEKKLKRIKVKRGTHPYLSKKNIQASKRIINLLRNSAKDDLIICLISGGGSALFEIPYNSFIKTLKINQKLLKCGASIQEINTIRKHISKVKGGQLLKFTSAKIISLIFSDAPGDNLDIIASGSTVLDQSTIKDAEKIIKKYKLPNLHILETPKSEKLFQKVDNFIILNNRYPLEKMKKRAEEIGFNSKIITCQFHGKVKQAIKKIVHWAQEIKKNELYLLAGETTVEVKGKGKGGRNTELALYYLKNYIPHTLFISFASDGLDNTEAAGAIVDDFTLKKFKKLNLSIDDYLNNNDSYNFFKKTNDLIFTGPTGSNVSDLILIMKY